MSFGAPATDASTFALLNTNNASLLTGTNQVGLTANITGSGTSSVTSIRTQPNLVDSLTVTSVYGLYVAIPNSSGVVTIGTSYGIHIENLANATTNIGINSAMTAGADKWFLFDAAGATSHLTGALGLGQATQANMTSRLNIGTNADTTATGGIKWGDTGLSNLYRSAADTLKTDGNFVVAGNTFFNGSALFNYAATKTAHYVITTADCVVPFDTSAAVADVNATLPASVAGNKGQMVIIKDVGGAVNLFNKRLNIVPDGTDTIDGTNTTITMSIPRFSLTLIANGAGGWTLH
jgi:hypothetical protein